MRGLEDDGLLTRGRGKRLRPVGRLPAVAVLDVAAIDQDGELIVRPVAGDHGGDATASPRIRLLNSGRGRAPAVGDRILARLNFLDGSSYEARVIKILPRPPERLVGILEQTRSGPVVRPLDRKHGRELPIERAHVGEARPGELVMVERQGDRPLGIGSPRIAMRLGDVDDAGSVSLLAACSHDLPIDFSPDLLELAGRARPVGLGRRVDLRALPLVTIDGVDARDFDDAVFARPDDHPDNPGGWQITVAIADVAHYVRPDDPLDIEARARGNSTYFPDRVLPMLPEPLSNGLCSLRPQEDRACLALHLWLDKAGRKRRHRFERGVMRSHARLTYQQVQAARDGRPDDLAAPLVATVIEPLYGAFEALSHARRARGTLDLDLPELEVVLDDEGRPVDVATRPRLDAHRLIEEFMIMANVAAAETLEQRSASCMYRVHDHPDPVKLEGLGQLLHSLGVIGHRTLGAKPKDLARLLHKTRDHPLGPLVSNLLLRAQSQAVYSPRNLGHYGLNLARYAHFTSPIRRYADLFVHRALIRALKLGEGGLAEEVDIEAHEQLGGHLSRRERRSMEAERSAKDRFVALLMADRIGAVFPGRIASVHRFGLFVQIDEVLADALVPISTLSAHRLDHDMTRHALVDRKAGTVWALGDRVEIALTEADTATGRLTCRLIAHSPGPDAASIVKGRRRKQPKPQARRGRKR